MRTAAAWPLLAALTVAGAAAMFAIDLPAASLMAAMGSACLLAGRGVRIAVPARIFMLAQGVVGCLVARSLTVPLFREIGAEGLVMAIGIVSVIVASFGLGLVLARLRVLPGSVPIWGMAPGAANAMVLMAEDFGADMRLVAVMQYLRVVLVTVVAALVALIWSRIHPNGAHHAGANMPAWFAAIDARATGETCAVVVAGVVLSGRIGIPAGGLIVPMLAATLLQDVGLMRVGLPYPLLQASYVVVGWAIGLRFDCETLGHAAHALPRVAASILALTAICMGLAGILVGWLGIDPLSAYLATSPGGADSVAIIAASTHVDTPFVMAMQVGRFVIVLLVGPAVARAVARLVGKGSQRTQG